jgi:hypothetical protein
MRLGMSDWIHGLPVVWMGVVVFGATYLMAAAIWLATRRLATGDRVRSFKAVSPGLLSPLGVIFGLMVAFLAAQVWSDVDRANTSVNREASALRAVVLLAARFPGESETRLRQLLDRYIDDVQRVEWPQMARNEINLTMIPAPLADALAVAVALPAGTPGASTAQREILAALEGALDARRQRILISHSQVNWVKWSALLVQALCTLVAIALVHSDQPLGAGIALGLFATAIGVCILLVAAHDRPFTGELGIQPTVLINVRPGSPGQAGP